MAARAIWKGVIRFGEAKVPVKLYSALEDKNVHFRLLHEKDHVPVKQAMVNQKTGDVVPMEEVRRGYPTEDEQFVILNGEELDALEPEASRDIEVTQFFAQSVIDHRWYDRPYYLGPDDSSKFYSALISALKSSKKEGLAHWVMRKKSYFGALRLHGDYPVLITLRHAEEVIAASELEAPKGRATDKKELAMAEQLVGMLEDTFDPTRYRNEYRGRLLELIDLKAKGRVVSFKKARPKKQSSDLSKALQASLKQAKERKSA